MAMSFLSRQNRCLAMSVVFCLCSLLGWAQSEHGRVYQTSSEQVTVHRQQAFPQQVPAGNYSGITWLGGSRYAVANDKSPTAGFHLFTIDIDSISGQLLRVRCDSFMTSSQPNRDEEGICYVPQRNTLFVSGEADGQIIEYRRDGSLTGRRLLVPDIFQTAYPNGSFEALTYHAPSQRFWTTSENTLRADGSIPTLQQRGVNRLRLQSFGEDMKPREQYWYETDSSVVKASKQKGRSILGVSGLAALDDGRIVVLERELYFPPAKLGAFVHVKLYVVNPSQHQPGERLQKTLLTEFRTKMQITPRTFANYEGLCAGPQLVDGSTVLVLVCDSQNQYKGYLKDWFKTVVIKK